MKTDLFLVSCLFLFFLKSYKNMRKYFYLKASLEKKMGVDFPGDAVDKNLPANAGN